MVDFDKIWVEKYRPRTMNDVVLQDDQRRYVEKCLADEQIGHLLFVGPQGSGKTTTARIICSKLIKSRMDIFKLNGSASTGVDTVRKWTKPLSLTNALSRS